MKEKQIEEMAKVVGYTYTVAKGVGAVYPSPKMVAMDLYDAGYRKQEWISVEDRLPEQSGKYLVCTKNGNVYQTKFYYHPENKGGHWGQKDRGKSITHWMPLPDAPKGGEQE